MPRVAAPRTHTAILPSNGVPRPTRHTFECIEHATIEGWDGKPIDVGLVMYRCSETDELRVWGCEEWPS